jgi:hypothetical protein
MIRGQCQDRQAGGLAKPDGSFTRRPSKNFERIPPFAVNRRGAALTAFLFAHQQQFDLKGF